VTVNETWSQGKDTEFVYDFDGNVTTRKTDGALSNDFANGKFTLFDYDSAGRERRMRVWRGEPPANHTGAQRTVTRTYWPSSHARTVTRSGATDRHPGSRRRARPPPRVVRR
jgi:hypothetical protein